MSTAKTGGARRDGYRAGSIEVRRMDLEFPDSMPGLWFDDNAFLTALLSALSVAFPPGERFFIASVRHYLPQVEDPELRAQIFAFIGQEANHTKEHIAFNAFLDRKGYPAAAMQRWVEKRIAYLQAHSSPEANLARTAALEHFTAILAGAFLENPEVLETMSPRAATLWAWHAIEEVEHRAVAFDVYQRHVGDEGLRIRTMLLVTVFFTALVSIRTGLMMRVTGTADPRAILGGLRTLWIRPGMLRKILPQYLAYYRRDFHPSEHDNASWVERAKRRYVDARPPSTG